jgi:4-amino-4-deoxy-L-arabinose transferase-like glycosyltransferase
MKPLQRREAALAALALFAWLAFTAWARPLTLPDEGRYAGVAWEMLQSGRWAVPTLDGMPFFHKPPLFYWISAAAMAVFGPHAWAARMPSVLGAVLAAWSLWLFTRRWDGEREARRAALILATQPFFFIGGQFANLDMLVAGCISATVLLGAHAVLLAEAGLPHRRALLGAYAMAGLGVLAKGLIGGVLPAGVFIVWLLASRRPALILRLVSLPGLGLFLLVVLPWFVAMQLRYPGFFDYFVIYHHFQRFAHSGFNNEHPFWFYVPVILLLIFPWTLAVVAVPRQGEGDARPSVTALMWSWLAVIVVFFSLPRSKLVGYVLPALPPLAALIAAGLCAQQGRLARMVRPLAVAAGVLCVGGVVAAVFYTPHSARPLGKALRELHAAGEPVVFLDRYPYDLPFYARLAEPPLVLNADWHSPEIVKHDDWHKELYDAGLFEPTVAARQLVGRDALLPRLCAQPVSWIVGSRAEVAADPWFKGATEVKAVKDASLWKLSRSSLSCPGTPSDGSAGK